MGLHFYELTTLKRNVLTSNIEDRLVDGTPSPRKQMHDMLSKV